MERLFSPWRSKYIESFGKSSDEQSGCILCTAHSDGRDSERLIVFRGKLAFVIMNLYPYNSGHVMVVPYRHLPSLTDLSDEEMLEIMTLLKRMINALKTVASPDGYNIGSNLGRTAGAGIDQHIHFHLVPRWNGDTNFMPVLADVKMISEEMRETFDKLQKVLKTV